MKPIDFDELDSTVHGPIRLAILTLLTIDGPTDFSSLKKRLKVADGLLGSHLTKLEQCGYVSCLKRFIRKRPNTTYRVEAAGSEAFSKYLDTMSRLIEAVEQKRNEQLEEPPGKESQ